MTVLELKGFKSLRALNVFHTLLLGMKMLPMHAKVSYEVFYESFKDKPDSEKETLLREAAVFVELQEDEVAAVLAFVADKNGVPIGSHNLKNLTPTENHESVVAVCKEIGRNKNDILSESEKKKLIDSVSISGKSSQNIPS